MNKKRAVPYECNRTMFNLTHDVKLTTDMGKFVPFDIVDCVPGDIHDIDVSHWVNFQPTVAPFLEDVDICFMYTFTPYRLLDENFEKIVMMNEMLATDTSLENVGTSASGIIKRDGVTIQGAVKSFDGSEISVPRWYIPTSKYKRYPMTYNNPTVTYKLSDGTVVNSYTLEVNKLPSYIVESDTTSFKDFLLTCVSLKLINDPIDVDGVDSTKTVVTGVSYGTGLDMNTHTKGSLFDYMGFPINKNIKESNAPMDYIRRAYYLSWNEFIRDEYLQKEVPIEDVYNDVVLNVNWEKDYFTDCTINQQLGVAPALPLSGVLPIEEIYHYAYGENVPANSVEVSPANSLWIAGNKPITIGLASDLTKNIITNQDSKSNTQVQSKRLMITRVPHRAGIINEGYVSSTTSQLTEAEYNDGNGESLLGVNAENLATFDIADLRLASSLQRWKERNNLTGIHYCDYLKMNYGVSPTDERLQRPEFVGSCHSKVTSNPVIQTAVDTSAESTPVGTRYGNASGFGNGYIGRYRVQEFGVLMGFVYLKPKCNYVSQGINRQFMKENVFDFYHPLFVNISDQEVRNCELYTMDESDTYKGVALSGKTSTEIAKFNNDVWGFTGRYDEMRYKPNVITSGFRDTFDYWHFGRKFDSLPNLSGEFIECHPAMRPFAVQDEDTIMLDIGVSMKSARPIPYISVPKLI